MGSSSERALKPCSAEGRGKILIQGLAVEKAKSLF